MVGLFVVSSAIPVLGALCLVIGGIALAISTAVSNVAIPMLAAVLGTGIAMTLSYDAPQGDDWLPFIAGAVLMGGLIVAVAVTIADSVRESWFRIATPIMGSWLVAIGVILAATTLLPRSEQTPPIAVHPPAEVQRAPQP